jgi:hypothetical protein
MRILLAFIMMVWAGSAYAQQSPIPSSSASIGIKPTVTASAVNNLVIKAAPGNLYSVYATNMTSTAGFLMILNAASTPGDGAVAPLDCIPIAGTSTSSINYAPGPPKAFSTGIIAVVSSGADCWTKMTGTITAFISGSAP